MARVLILGCGCRGRALGRELAAAGHVVRGTSRSRAGLAAIEADGLEPWPGDPDRVGSLVRGFEHVTLLVHLLGSAEGSPEAVAALHDERMRMLFERTCDSTIRGLIYEAGGSLPADLRQAGQERWRTLGEHWGIPTSTFGEDPADHETWLAGARGAVEGMLEHPGLPYRP